VPGAQSGAHTGGPGDTLCPHGFGPAAAYDPGILRQALGLLPREIILIYISQGPRSPHPCRLAMAARAGFAAGTTAQVTAGTGVLHLACRVPGNTDRLLQWRHLSVLPGRPSPALIAQPHPRQ